MKNLLIALIFGLIASCAAPRVITERTISDTTIIREIPRIVTIPAERVQSPSINLDSLVYLIQSGVSHETITKTLIREDPETKLRVGIMLDHLGNLTAVCEQQERTIELMEREIERLRTETINKKEIHKPTIWKTIKAGFNLLIFSLVIIIILILTIRYRSQKA
jgi:uncharacterized small protein (DUF1192 family)